MDRQTNDRIQLRDYQQALIHLIYEHWETKSKVMVQLATGGGKTVIFSAIANEFLRRQERVLVLAHREELVIQAANKLEAITGNPVGIIKAGYKPDPLLPIQVASVQTLVNRLPDHLNFGLVVIDEAHHSVTQTYQKILDAYPNAKQLGVTATPIRSDGTGFRGSFDEIVSGPPVTDLIQKGHLSDFRLFADPKPMITKGVKISCGDFSASDLAKRNDVVELSGNLVRSYCQYADGKRCLVFAFNVAYSKAIAQRYKDAGIPAIHLDGETPTEYRQEALRRFAEGEIKVITNCALFGEGLDIPAIDAVQIARPTKSLGLWLQMVGRALRPSPGKDYAILLDHTKNYSIHGLPTHRRIWTLDGVEYSDETQKRERKPKEEVEPVLVEVVEKPVQLKMINEPTLEQYWLMWFQDTVALAKSRGYQIEWVYYQLMEEIPPLFIFQEYAKLKGYNPGWAKHKYQEAHQLADMGSQQKVKLRDPCVDGNKTYQLNLI